MNTVRDPVCEMDIDHERAAGQAAHQGDTYYFCSEACVVAFREDPDRYAGDRERHEPPYTLTRHMAAPKFGSAGRGGLENEPGPERHGRS